MTYTIAQISKKLKLSTHTLRFYEKEGILPFIERDINGNRIFQEQDLRWLELVECFKGTGMPLKEIRAYLDLCHQGDSTLEERLAIMKEHKIKMQAELAKIKNFMKKIDYKLKYYQTAVERGTEKGVFELLNGNAKK